MRPSLPDPQGPKASSEVDAVASAGAEDRTSSGAPSEARRTGSSAQRPQRGVPVPARNVDGDDAVVVEGDAAVGQLWSIDAGGLDPALLAGEAGVRALGRLFDALVAALELHPVMEPRWHVFPPPHAGVTGFVALSESHLACHTFPEHAGLTLDLYTCRERPAPDLGALIAHHLVSDEPSAPGVEPRTASVPIVRVTTLRRGVPSRFSGSPAGR